MFIITMDLIMIPTQIYHTHPKMADVGLKSEYVGGN